MQSGINYFVNLLGLTPSSFGLYYEFDNSGQAFVPSVSGANPVYSGQLSSIGSFYSLPGSGYFTGQNIQIQNETGLFGNSWTMFFVYDKRSDTNATLFSCYHGSGVLSGFAIGVSDANKLYFETYSPQGPQIVECPLQLGQKNAVSISNVGNAVSFSVFDMNTKQTNSFSGPINSKYLLNSTGWYVGDSVNAPAYYSRAPFIGYMDSFLYFTPSLYPYQTSIMFSGFYSNGTGIPNSGYLYSFGMDGIAMIENVDDEDFVEARSFPQETDLTTLNQIAIYDRANQYFIMSESYPYVNAYVNGLALVQSGFSITGTIYNLGYQLSGDFAITGQALITNNYLDINDDLIYDAISGGPALETFYSGESFAAINSQGSDLFFNGVKLRSGIDYLPSGSMTQVIDPILLASCGNLLSLPVIQSEICLASGEFDYFTGQRFAMGTSQVWLNGLRQQITYDYVEISNIDLLIGSGTFPLTEAVILNDLNFWEP